MYVSCLRGNASLLASYPRVYFHLELLNSPPNLPHKHSYERLDIYWLYSEAALSRSLLLYNFIKLTKEMDVLKTRNNLLKKELEDLNGNGKA